MNYLLDENKILITKPNDEKHTDAFSNKRKVMKTLLVVDQSSGPIHDVNEF